MTNMTMVTTTLTFILLLVFFLIQYKSEHKLEEKQPFECGFSAKSNRQTPFSFNYFYITIIFLIFDLEILLILPFVVFFSSSMAILFILTLLAYFSGLLIMEWYNNLLEWNS